MLTNPETLDRLCGAILRGHSVARAAIEADIPPEDAYREPRESPAGQALDSAIRERNRRYGVQWCGDMMEMSSRNIPPASREKRRALEAVNPADTTLQRRARRTTRERVRAYEEILKRKTGAQKEA